jgi:hypothetical protein
MLLANTGGGVHGNAILTKYDFVHTRALVHATQPFDWNLHGNQYGQPRHGARVAAVADIRTPVGVISCYCVHLENYCGMVCLYL